VPAREAVEIERTAIGRPVEAMPAVREEGDTIVVPIVEEVLVVERRLMLKEEVRIRRVRSTQRHQERVTLRHQEAVVTRVRAEQPGDGERAGGGAEASERPGADGRVIPPSSPRS
jgi:stress response protein YsnF